MKWHDAKNGPKPPHGKPVLVWWRDPVFGESWAVVEWYPNCNEFLDNEGLTVGADAWAELTSPRLENTDETEIDAVTLSPPAPRP